MALAGALLVFKIWRELPARRMEQLDYLERLRGRSRSRREGEDRER